MKNCTSLQHFEHQGGCQVPWILGPASGTVQWQAPIEKFAERCVDVKHNDVPLVLGIGQFNIKPIRVSGCVAQLVLPPVGANFVVPFKP